MSVATMHFYLDSKAGDVPGRDTRLADHGVAQFPRTYVERRLWLRNDCSSCTLRHSVSAAKSRTDSVEFFRKYLDDVQAAITVR
jgi:hypothetical protein